MGRRLATEEISVRGSGRRLVWEIVCYRFFFFLVAHDMSQLCPAVSIFHPKKKEKKKKKRRSRTRAVMSTHFPCLVHVRQECGNPNACLRFPVNKGVFGLVISITHISVFITHNSKIVGPITKRLFGKSITLFP